MGKNFAMDKIVTCIYYYLSLHPEKPMTIVDIYLNITPNLTPRQMRKHKDPFCTELIKHEKVHYDEYYKQCNNMDIYKNIYSFKYNDQKYIFYTKEENWTMIKYMFLKTMENKNKIMPPGLRLNKQINTTIA